MYSGRCLSEIVASGPLAADPLLAIGTALAEVVVAAHAESRTFGALTPATVFVTDRGSVRVLDAAEAPISARREDDLQALGTLLYVMATGVTPHRAARGHDDGPMAPSPIELNPRLPSGLVRLIQRCVHPDAGERFRSAEEIGEALHEVRRAPGSLESLLPTEHVSSSAAVKPPPRPPADERGHGEAEQPEPDELCHDEAQQTESDERCHDQAEQPESSDPAEGLPFPD